MKDIWGLGAYWSNNSGIWVKKERLDMLEDIPIVEDVFIPSISELVLIFDDIANADTLVGNSSGITEWNSFFDHPTYGSPFTGVVVTGNTVKLYNGKNMTIKDNLFSGYTHLISISDNFSVDKLGNNVFSGSTNLTSISLPILTSAGDYSFSYCVDLITINLPKLSFIGLSAFENCHSLFTIHLPILTTLSQSCFSNCYNLTSINFSVLTTIGQDCFSGCTSLKTAQFYYVTSMGSGAFQYCSGITAIHFPSLTGVSDGSFAYCKGVSSIGIPICTSLGSTTGDDGVFTGITGRKINLMIPPSLMTCNGGNPDGDISYLVANNVEIVFVYVT